MCTWVTISKQLTYPFLNFNGCTTDTADIRFNKVTQIPFQMHFLNENYHRSIRSLFYWSNLQLIITSSRDDLASDSRQSITLTDSFIYAFPGLKESRSFMVLNVTSTIFATPAFPAQGLSAMLVSPGKGSCRHHRFARALARSHCKHWVPGRLIGLGVRSYRLKILQQNPFLLWIVKNNGFLIIKCLWFVNF